MAIRLCFSTVFSSVLAAALAGCTPGGGEGKSITGQIADAQQEARPEVRVKKLIKLARVQARGNDTVGTESTLSIAARHAKAIDVPEDRADLSADVAQAQAEMKLAGAARASIRAAVEAAGKIEEAEVKAASLVRVAEAQNAVGEQDNAAATLARAETVAEQLKDGDGNPDTRAQAQTLACIAAGYAKIGRPAEADRVFAATAKLAESLAGRRRADALLALASARGGLGQKDQALKALSAAAQAARGDSDAYRAAKGLAAVAEQFAKLGEPAQARGLFDEAELGTKKIPDGSIQGTTLQEIRVMAEKALKPARP